MPSVPLRVIPRAALATVLLLAAAGEAWARAGGGGGFGGGGGGGGGSGGGYGGGGGDLGALVHLFILAVRYPLFGIPAFILIVFLMYQSATKGRGRYQGRTIRRARQRRRLRITEGVETLVRKDDPEFTKAAFLARVMPAFRKLQDAWCAHDLEPVRPFISDGIHERFQLQLAEQRDLGYRDRMDDLTIDATELAHFRTEGPVEALTVAITATAVDHRVRLRDGSHLSGSRRPELFREYWTFVRRRGARTRPGRPGLMEGNCPNCGAGVRHNQWAQCRHCQSLLRSGEHDWVLAEITQAGEWRTPTTNRPIPGLRQLRAKDAALSVQVLEDRASVLFWRWSMAVRAGTTRPVRGVVTERGRAQIEAELGASSQSASTRTYVGERAVGAVDVLGFVAEGDEERALVSVRWSGVTFAVASDGDAERLRPTDVTTTWLELVRRAGYDSGFAAGLSSAHCAGCGAPQSVASEGDAGGACDFCGEPLADGNHGWLLDQLHAPWSREAKELRRRLGRRTGGGELQSTAPPEPEPEREAPPRAGVLCWMADVARADGGIGPKEAEALHALGRRVGVRGSFVEDLIEDRAPHATPGDAEEAREWMMHAARMAYADGRLDRSERELLLRLGGASGLVKADVRLLLNQARAELYQEAKRELRRDR